MSDPDHSIDPTDVLISPANAALTDAEAEAAGPDSGLVFLPEWHPELRTRSSTSPQGTSGAANQPLSWASINTNQLSHSGLLLQQDPPAPPPAYAAVLPPPAASEPASTLPPGDLPSSQPEPLEGAVAELLKRNQVAFDNLVNHSFPQTLGKGTASLDGFRYYMIQDSLYLETCARLKMIAVAASPNFDAIKEFESRHRSSIEYTEKLKEICTTMLGIKRNDIEGAQRSIELDTSERFYKDTLRKEDALLAYYVVLLPCVLAYWEIAKRLMEDSSTVRNVVYHTAWTVVNYDPSSVDKYTKFINQNIAAQGGIDKWNYVFNIACLLEAELFKTGEKSPTPFQIIRDGIYSIHISSMESVVLAMKNVKNLLGQPLDELPAGYVLSDAGLSVVGMNKTGGDNEKWHVVVTKTGYTFRNLGTQLYLGISTESDREESRTLQAVSEPYHWWINPISSQPVSSQLDQESSLYQIYDSENLRYTLHADIKALGDIANSCPVIVHENSEIFCQIWSFNDIEQSEHVQIRPEPDDHNLADAELGKQLQKAQTTIAELETKLTEYRNAGLGKQLQEAQANIAELEAKLAENRNAGLGEQLQKAEARNEELEIMLAGYKIAEKLQKAQAKIAELEGDSNHTRNDLRRQALTKGALAKQGTQAAKGPDGQSVASPSPAAKSEFPTMQPRSTPNANNSGIVADHTTPVGAWSNHTTMEGYAAVESSGAFYAYIHNIADDGTSRWVITFESREIADEWWRAVSTTEIVPLKDNIKRITPQFYTHNTKRWKLDKFFTDNKLKTLSEVFRGKMFFVLENDRGGRGITIIPTQSIIDRVSGNWFSIRSKAYPNQYWYYDESLGCILVSNTERTLFQLTATTPNLQEGSIMIGGDEVTLFAPHGPVILQQSPHGATILGVAPDTNASSQKFKFSDFEQGKFIPDIEDPSPSPQLLYVPGGGPGNGWELAL